MVARLRVQSASALLASILAAAMSAGCIERTITITSEPSGALVHLNDQEIGRTPKTVPFTFYGLYDVRLDKEDHIPLWTTRRAKTSWWETPGLDLIAEMVPHLQAPQNWHFTLEPRPENGVDRDDLVDRAQQLRATLKSGSQD